MFRGCWQIADSVLSMRRFEPERQHISFHHAASHPTVMVAAKKRCTQGPFRERSRVDVASLGRLHAFGADSELYMAPLNVLCAWRISPRT